MTRTIGIGIFVALVLSLAAVACGGGPSSGATGAGGHVLLEIDELGAESDLVVLGELNSSEKITKTVQDTSQPADLRGDDYIIQVKQVSFTVSEYLKGSGDDTITITLPSEDDDFDPHGTDAKLAEDTQYVVFLFDPSLRIGDEENFWGDTYLGAGSAGSMAGERERRATPQPSQRSDTGQPAERDQQRLWPVALRQILTQTP